MGQAFECCWKCHLSGLKVSYPLVRFGTSPVIILIVVVIICYHFFAGIYSYIPETDHVPRIYVMAILYSQFMAHVMLFSI